MSDPTVTYRDATISEETRDELEQLATWLRGITPRTDLGLLALDDVVARWDANEATEMVVDGARA